MLRWKESGRDRRFEGDPMKGLTVRWSLAEAADHVAGELSAYVANSSHARFTGMAGLKFKTWRMRPGEWFEGAYVFTSDQARADLLTH
jgi:hypothetical protein